MGNKTSESVTLSKLQQSSGEQDLAEKVFACLMEVKHIPQVCEIEQICFASPWSMSMFSDELEKNPLSRYFVLLDRQEPQRVLAYAGYWKILDEGHITNVAVRPEWREQHLGQYVMRQMMAFAAAEGIQSMTLEVRESNQAAQALYKKLGFIVEGLRKKYYEDNHEDALIMWYRTNDKQGEDSLE